MTLQTPCPHDLLRVRAARECFDFEGAADVAFDYVERDAFVVVRRSAHQDGKIPVGIRGETRSERYAAWVSPEAIVEVVRPADLLRVPAKREVAAFVAMTLLKARWCDMQHAWGPTGSVGFELASGRPVVSAASDLDILLRVDAPITREQAAMMSQAICNLPCKVDVQVETAAGAFALEEFALGTGATLLRTISGPVLTSELWQRQVAA